MYIIRAANVTTRFVVTASCLDRSTKQIVKVINNKITHSFEMLNVIISDRVMTSNVMAKYLNDDYIEYVPSVQYVHQQVG